MPNRVIKESIKTSEQIDSLTWFEEVIYYRLLVTADDYGCADGRSVLLKSELFPLKENVTKKSVDDAISKLVNVGLLCKYTANGKPYLFFPTWEKHQRIRNKHRKYPEPPPDICQSFDRQMTASCLPESNPNPNPYPNIPSPDGEGSGDFPGKPPAPAKSDLQTVVDAWNTLDLTTVTKLTEGTNRHIMLKKRLADYGLDEVLRAIENVRASPFLNGRNRRGFTCTFDWFLKPNNFPKVLDGNYNDDEKPKFDPKAYDGARWLAQCLSDRVSGFQPPKPQELDRWAADLDALHGQGYTWKQISDTAVWALNDDFWAPVIVSGESLRKNFVKLLSKKEGGYD